MRTILAAALLAVVGMSTPCWGKVPPQDQSGRASAASPRHIADDEWKMMESACRGQRARGSTAYNACLGRQVKALEASPGKPSLANASSEERATIEAACRKQGLSHGAAAYYDCLRQQLAMPAAMRIKPSVAGTPDVSAQRQSAAKPRAPASPASGGSGTANLGTPARASQQTAQPAAASANSSNPAPPTTSAYQPYIVGLLIFAAVAGLLGIFYRVLRGAKCGKCGNRFRGPGAYCSQCTGAMREHARRVAAQRPAEEQPRADDWDRRRQHAEQEAGAYSSHQQARDRARHAGNEPGSGLDPYAILGVARNASKEEIRAAYLRQMANYHPDKVAHLGEDLQELAKRKAQAINRAYEELLQAT